MIRVRFLTPMWRVSFFFLLVLSSLQAEDEGEALVASFQLPGFQKFVPFNTRVIMWNIPESSPFEQLVNSTNLVYATLFQSPETLKKMGFRGQDLADYQSELVQQVRFLRRLVLLLYYGGLEYKNVSGKICRWPFPLATSLTHGQRILIELKGVKPEAFLAYLTDETPHLLYSRRYSSHGVEYAAKTGVLEEKKIKSPLRKLKKTEALYGMDIPFGGVGNKLPNGFLIGPRGYEAFYTGRGHLLLNKKHQTGHVHMYTRYFPKTDTTAILIGIEACAPGKKNQFGCRHDVLSGVLDQRKNPSVSAGVKWSKLAGSASPVEYRGKFITLDRLGYEDVVTQSLETLQRSEEELKQAFQSILC